MTFAASAATVGLIAVLGAAACGRAGSGVAELDAQSSTQPKLSPVDCEGASMLGDSPAARLEPLPLPKPSEMTPTSQTERALAPCRKRPELLGVPSSPISITLHGRALDRARSVVVSLDGHDDPRFELAVKGELTNALGHAPLELAPHLARAVGEVTERFEASVTAWGSPEQSAATAHYKLGQLVAARLLRP